jgi:hypothetical protein
MCVVGWAANRQMHAILCAGWTNCHSEVCEFLHRQDSCGRKAGTLLLCLVWRPLANWVVNAAPMCLTTQALASLVIQFFLGMSLSFLHTQTVCTQWQ